MSVVHALGSQKPLGRHSLALLIGLQLLLVLTVALGGWGASAYLRQLTLTRPPRHAQAQAYNLEDALSQSFHLLKMHLQALGKRGWQKINTSLTTSPSILLAYILLPSLPPYKPHPPLTLFLLLKLSSMHSPIT